MINLNSYTNYLVDRLLFAHKQNTVFLTLREQDSKGYAYIKLTGAYIFDTTGVLNLPIKSIHIRPPGLFFSEYCRANHIQGSFSQLEIVLNSDFLKPPDAEAYHTLFFLFETIGECSEDEVRVV